MTATFAARHHTHAFPPISDLGGRLVSFLTLEADLLDEWRLDEWFGLFQPDARYVVLPLQQLDDAPTEQNLCLISDDYRRLQARVEHLLGSAAWMEQPRSRTRRLFSNLRFLEPPADDIKIKVNFVVYQFRNHESWEFVGSASYSLVPFESTFRIRARLIKLDHESIAKQRRISIII